MTVIKKSVSIDIIDKEMTCHNECKYLSRFSFLRSTNGLRHRMLIGIMATSGSGKSSVTQAIITDAAINNNVLVWMSEETVTEYQIGLHRTAKDIKNLKNIYFIEEKGLKSDIFANQDRFLNYFKELVIESGCSIIFIDNITTSFFYSDDIGPSGQSKAAMYLAKLTKELDVTIFYVAHTAKRVIDNQSTLITREDIRGSLKINMLAEYLYILQRFTSEDNIYSIIHISKHRFHSIKDRFYLLKFKDDNYVSDIKISFGLVNNIFKQRDVLGQKDK